MKPNKNFYYFVLFFFYFPIYSNLFADERIDKCLELEELRGKK